MAEPILETAGRLVLRDRGVPLPIPQYELWAPDGTRLARLDGAYLREKVALEFDGADPHGLPEAVLRDRWRQNGLPELGWTVLRFTWWDVMLDPDGVGHRAADPASASVLKPESAGLVAVGDAAHPGWRYLKSGQLRWAVCQARRCSSSSRSCCRGSPSRCSMSAASSTSQ
ncbi:MAG: DUF559 domain-containing protein [Pseudonocardiales bacterium]|nr:DUF559 domain-containing protein [Pseudonocardiales bacterium]